MNAVQHIALNCRDLRAQERFYSKHFGFRRARVFNAGRADGIATDEIIDCSSIVNGLRICFFNDPDGNRVELMQGFQDQYTP